MHTVNVLPLFACYISQFYKKLSMEVHAFIALLLHFLFYSVKQIWPQAAVLECELAKQCSMHINILLVENKLVKINLNILFNWKH